jgi:hypothetical protein
VIKILNIKILKYVSISELECSKLRMCFYSVNELVDVMTAWKLFLVPGFVSQRVLSSGKLLEQGKSYGLYRMSILKRSPFIDFTNTFIKGAITISTVHGAFLNRGLVAVERTTLLLQSEP